MHAETKTHADDDRCVSEEGGHHLSQLSAALALRIFFFAFVAGSQDVMVQHFVSHYTALGVDLVARSNITVHTVGGAYAVPERRCAHFIRSKGIPFAIAESWSSQAKLALANAYIRTLPPDALLMYPDLDEFFRLPCDLDHRVRAPIILKGGWVDRLAPRWACAPQPRLQPTPSIFAQFSTRCFGVVAAGSISGTASTKVVLISVRDANRRVVQYRSAHHVGCYEAAELTCTAGYHCKRSEGHSCEHDERKRGMPNIPHFHFTHDAILLKWRKLAIYRDLKNTSAWSDHDAASGVKVKKRTADPTTHIAQYSGEVAMFVQASGASTEQEAAAVGSSQVAPRAGFLFRPELVALLKNRSCSSSC